MLGRLIIATFILLLMPVAAADGFGASARYLEGHDGCWYSDSTNGTYSNGSWWYRESWWRGCNDHFDYAGAHAWNDDGSLAGAEADATGSEHSYGSRNEEGWWMTGGNSSHSQYAYSSYYSHYDTWDRSARAHAANASAGATYGCGSAWSSSYGSQTRSSSYRFNDTSGSSSYDYDSWGYSSGSSACEQRATLQNGGDASSAGFRSACASSSWSRDSYDYDAWSGNDSSEWWQSSRSSWDNCSDRASVYGPVAADAGTTRACRAWSYDESYTHSYDNTTSGGWYDYSYSECEEGVSANGPDDASVFVGNQRSSSSDCYSDDGQTWCYDHAWSAYGVVVDWEHSPLGPGPHGFMVPLP